MGSPNFITNTRGLSLLEALVGLSIMLIGALALGSMIANQNKMIAHSQSRLDSQEIEEAVKNTLNRANSCRISLNSSNVVINLNSIQSSYPIQRINSYDNNNQLIENIVTRNSAYPSSQVVVRNINLTEVRRVSANSGYGTLKLDVSAPNGPALKQIAIKQLHFRLRPNNTIEDCRTTGDMAAAVAAVLATTQAVTASECLSQHRVTVQATCNPGYRLLSCTGSSGDVDEHDEGYRILSNFQTNTCTLDVQQARCGDTGDHEALQRQRITAYCYQIE